MEIREWLQSVELPQYAALFEQNCVEVAALGQITDAQLRSMGVDALGHRLRILQAARSGDGAASWPEGLEPEELPTWLALPLGEYLGEPNPRVKLHWMLDTIEVALRWAAAIALAEVRRANDGALPETLQRSLRDHIERPTVGRWVGMLRTLSESTPEGALAPGVFELHDQEIAPRFTSEGEETKSILVLRNRVAHGGGLSSARSAELLKAHEPGFFALMRAIGAVTAGLEPLARFGGAISRMVGLEPAPRDDAPADLPEGACLFKEGALLPLAPLAAWGPLCVMGRDGHLHQRGEGMAAQIYARAGAKSLSYTPLGRDEAHAESDAVAPFRALFGLNERRASADKPKGIHHRDALKEARLIAEDLVGRQAEGKVLKAWIKGCKTREADAPRIGWVAAGPGIGKTMLLAQVARDLGNDSRNAFYYHRFEPGDPRNSLRSFLQLLQAALWDWAPLKALTHPPDPNPGDLDELKEDVCARLARVGGLTSDNPRSPPPTARVLLDGVDALPDPELPGLIRELDLPGTIWVIAGRPDLGPAFSGPGCEAVFGPDGLPPMSADDIRAMLVGGLGNARYALLGRDEDTGDGAIRNRFVERVVERARGLPLYVRLLLEDLRSGLLSVADEDRLPEGLSAYYAELTSRMGVGDVQADLTLLVCLLARSEAPLSREGVERLLAVQDDPGHLESVLLAGGALLRDAPTASGGQGYALYHNGFRDFVNDAPSLRRTRRRAEGLLAAASDDWRALPPGDLRDHMFRWGVEYAVWWGGAEGLASARARLIDFAYLIARAGALPAWESWDLLREYDLLSERLGGDDLRFEAWRRFFKERIHLLVRGSDAWGGEKILLQQAIEYADESPVTQAAEAWMADGGGLDWLWIRRTERRGKVPPTACVAVFEGHRRKIDGALRAEDGRILSWSMDGTLRTWDWRDGRALVTMRGHGARVLGARMLSADEALSWSEDGTLRLWDIDEGAELRSLTGHGAPVLGAAPMPDGRLLSWSKDKTLRIWDLAGGGSAGPYKTGRSYPRAALPLSDGRFACYDTKTVQIWDPASPAKAQLILKGHDGDIGGLEALANGRLLSWSKDKTLRIWDLAAASGVALEGHQGPVAGALLLPGGRALSWSSDGTLRLWDLQAGALIRALEGHEGAVEGALLLSDGRALSWSADLRLRLWDLERGASTVSEEHMGEIRGAIELTDGRILTRANHGVLQAWDPTSGARLSALRGHSTETEGLMLTPEDTVLSWSWDRTLRRWSTDPALFAAIQRVEGEIDTSRFHQGFVNGARRAPDPRQPPGAGRVVSWSKDGTVRIWQGRAQTVLAAHGGDVAGVRLQEDGALAVSWGGDLLLKCWDLQSGSQRSTMTGHTGLIRDAAFIAPELGGGLLSWSSDGTLRRWDLERGAQTALFAGHEKLIQGAEVLPRGGLLSWSSDGTLRRWDLDSGAQTALFEGHEKLISGATVLPDGRLLSWSSDATLRIWDLDTGALIATLSGHNPKKAASGACLLPSGRLLSWSTDGTLRTWDLMTAAPVAIFEGHRDAVHAAAPTGPGRVISLGKDDTVRLWDAHNGVLLETISVSEAPFAWPDRWRRFTIDRRPTRAYGDAIADTAPAGVLLLTPGGVLQWHGDRGLWFVDGVDADGQILARDTKGLHFLQLYRGAAPVGLGALEGAGSDEGAAP